MGLFDSLKSAFGLASGRIAIEIDPAELYVGGSVRGTVEVRAERDLNIYALQAELLHSFPDEYGHSMTEIFDAYPLAERVSIARGESHSFPVQFGLDPSLAPSMRPFGWTLRARATLQGGAPIEASEELAVRLGPLMSGVTHVIQERFGFRFDAIGAAEDEIWLEFAPTGSVRNLYRGLQVSYDESDDALAIWIALDPFAPAALQRYAERYDPQENALEFVLDKGSYASGDQVDVVAIEALLRPAFIP